MHRAWAELAAVLVLISVSVAPTGPCSSSHSQLWEATAPGSPAAFATARSVISIGSRRDSAVS